MTFEKERGCYSHQSTRYCQVDGGAILHEACEAVVEMLAIALLIPGALLTIFRDGLHDGMLVAMYIALGRSGYVKPGWGLIRKTHPWCQRQVRIEAAMVIADPP